MTLTKSSDSYVRVETSRSPALGYVRLGFSSFRSAEARYENDFHYENEQVFLECVGDKDVLNT